jgi:hypothetical protein
VALARVSDYFQRLLEGDFLESRQDRITFKDLPADGVIALVTYSKTGTLPLTLDNALPIAQVADYVQRPDLKELAVRFIIQTATHDWCEALAAQYTAYINATQPPSPLPSLLQEVVDGVGRFATDKSNGCPFRLFDLAPLISTQAIDQMPVSVRQRVVMAIRQKNWGAVVRELEISTDAKDKNLWCQKIVQAALEAKNYRAAIVAARWSSDDRLRDQWHQKIVQAALDAKDYRAAIDVAYLISDLRLRDQWHQKIFQAALDAKDYRAALSTLPT